MKMYRLGARLPLALLLVSTSQASDKPLKAQDLVEQGNRLLASGEVNEAYKIYSEALEKDPENYITFYKRATAGITLGRSQSALDDLNRLLSLKPDFTKALYQRGKIHSKQGSLEQALGDLKNYLNSHPEDSEALQLVESVESSQNAFKLARGHIENGECEKASEHLSETLQTSPHWIEARRLRGNCAISQNLYDEAIGDWTRITQLSPSDAESLGFLAKVHYYSFYEPDLALTKVKQYLHSDPENKQFKTLFRTIKKNEKSLVKLQNSVKNKAWKDVLEQLNGSDGAKGLFEETKNSVSNMLIELGATLPGPDKLNGKLYTAACMAYSRTRNKEKTLDICSKSLEFFPDDTKLLVARSEGYLVKELFEKAIEDLTKAYELSDRDNKIGEKLQKARTLLKQSKQRDYYKILGVSRSAGQKEIKRAFLKQARTWHPDTYRGDLPKDEVEKKMAEINTAYEVLSNEELKARFDQGDDPNDPTGGHQHGGGNPFGSGDPFQFMFRQGGQGFQQHFKFGF